MVYKKAADSQSAFPRPQQTLFFCNAWAYAAASYAHNKEADMKLADVFDLPRQETVIPRPYIIAEAGVNHEGSMDTAPPPH